MKPIQRSAVLAVILALLAVCVLAIYSYQLKRRSLELVRAANEFAQKGQSPTIQELRQRFGTALRQPNPCIPEGCGYEVLLSNRVLSALHLAPYTVLRSYFWIRNGLTDVNSLQVWTAVVSSHVEVMYCDQCDSFTIVPWDDEPVVGSGSVEVGSISNTSQKRVALALDAGCLTKLGGCSNIAEFFPKVWQQTSTHTIHCRIPNRKGIVDKAAYLP